ncbi:MAG: chromosome partitioning protein ParA [Vibrio sp.]
MEQNHSDEHDDVVVIEERDKRTYLYIGIAAAIGLALGGLVGSTVTSSKWESAYHQLNKRYGALKQETHQQTNDAQATIAKTKDSIQKQIDAAVAKVNAQKDDKIKALEKQVSELEKVNSSLDDKVTTQKQTIAKVDKQKKSLNRKADLQASVFERSREIFQKELKTKQELEQLQKERDDLAPKLKTLKKDCDLYLAGTSWDAKSDACDKQDEAKSRLSQLDQMIHVHRMDLKQIQALTSEIGLDGSH